MLTDEQIKWSKPNNFGLNALSNSRNNQKRSYSTNNKKINTSPTIEPDNNFSMLQALGLEPDKVNIQASIKDEPVHWKYGDSTYKKAGSLLTCDTKVLDELLKSLDEGTTYSFMSMVMNKNKEIGRQVISLTRQILITNKIGTQEFENFFNHAVNIIRERYDDKDLAGDLIFRLKPISIMPGKFKEVTKKGVPITRTSDINTPHKGKSNLSEIPLTTDLSHYGINYKLDIDMFKRGSPGQTYDYSNNIKLVVKDVQIDPINNLHTREVDVYNLNSYSYTFKDEFYPNSNIFTRKQSDTSSIIDQTTQTILYTNTNLNPCYIKQKKPERKRNNHISTFDIETYVDNNGLFKPYACGWHIGNSGVNKTYYITDYTSSQDMIKSSIEDLIKYKPGTVYVHNLSKFDAYFLLNTLFENYNVKPTYKDRLILSLVVSKKLPIDDKLVNFKMTFKDSMLLLEGSLKSLGKTYSTDSQKGYFPYEFVNEERLNYKGLVPDYKYFKDQITQEEYNTIKNSHEGLDWDLKKETLNYLSDDTRTLWEILNKFSLDIWNERVNITSSSTISALAFNIYKTNYLQITNANLSQVKGNAHENMRSAYFGGRTEVYTPKGFNLQSFDCNSIYPYCMLKPMPVDQPVFSNDTNLNNYFGVVYAKVQTIKYNKYPSLPFRDPELGWLLFPLGNWEGWYCSEELKYATESGIYKVEIICGYKFKRGNNIFKQYVEKFYGIKSGTVKSPMGAATSKLLLNTLYGRFGMSPHKTLTTIIPEEKLANFINNHDVSEYFPLVPGFEFVRYSPSGVINWDNKNSVINPKNADGSFNLEQSLPISIFITAYARILMSDVIKHVSEVAKKKIYMTDTDCIWINSNLSPEFIGKEIGKFQKEFSATEAIFPAPKLYYAINKDGLEVKKGKGLKRGSLNRTDYLTLGEGKHVFVEEDRFIKDFKTQNIHIKLHKAKVLAEYHKRNPVLKNNLFVN